MTAHSATRAHELLTRLGVSRTLYTQGALCTRSPIDGAISGQVVEGTAADMQAAIASAHAAFLEWRVVPAPKRGELASQAASRLQRPCADRTEGGRRRHMRRYEPGGRNRDGASRRASTPYRAKTSGTPSPRTRLAVSAPSAGELSMP